MDQNPEICGITPYYIADRMCAMKCRKRRGRGCHIWIKNKRPGNPSPGLRITPSGRGNTFPENQIKCAWGLLPGLVVDYLGGPDMGGTLIRRVLHFELKLKAVGCFG